MCAIAADGAANGQPATRPAKATMASRYRRTSTSRIPKNIARSEPPDQGIFEILLGNHVIAREASTDLGPSNDVDFGSYINISGYIDKIDAISVLAALAQPTRLDVFRLLVRHEPDGLPVGELARAIAVPHNTMSTHLSILARAGLIKGERRSRSIIYRADVGRLREMTLFFVRDCCGGRPDLCASLACDLASMNRGNS